jgi:hypothetical protein
LIEHPEQDRLQILIHANNTVGKGILLSFSFHIFSNMK